MDPARLRKLLTDVRRGRVSTRKALEAIAHLPFESIGPAKVDHHRGIRQALPEVILCQGKTTAQCVAIARAVVAKSGRLLATRASTAQAEALLEEFEETAAWNEAARTVVVENGSRRRAVSPARRRGARVLVVSAGTADLPVAEEAAVTLEFMGVPVGRVYDVGVAGIHRILSRVPALRRASAIVVVAGMEGALASVVGGITDRPVIAVPTSVGYGSSFGGLAALLAMLNSCAAGVTVVNIDNGFGAGYAAGVIALRSRPGRSV
ncbi:MAG TPA: nickel pincer cofactor biosynthesis protein LarB [Candidatus Limnocylindrales bacterium]|jgi:NCAIR mutase (PurE)-related protein|nr:nickel pincer cofactor biosynthesis protein LarB [Candidatus Limnocylindrales bacterium]